MQKPKQLKPGDKVAIVSLSSGMAGDTDTFYQSELGVKRLQEFGLEVEFMPNALKGSEIIKNNPQLRASDLKQAFLDDSINGIICAVGGNDTYKTFEFLLNDQEFIDAVKNHPKVFIGSSDTTINHLMFYKLGLPTFYGHSLLVDFAELDQEMLPYSKTSFSKMFLNSDSWELKSSKIWYESRTDFSNEAVGSPRISHQEQHGYEVLRGTGIVEGKLLGGCLESIYEAMTSYLVEGEVPVFEKYQIFQPTNIEKDTVLFLETSGERPTPELFQKMLLKLKNQGVFQVIQAIIFGKPHDETYYEEYKQILLAVTEAEQLPILYNLNFGHAQPKAILPYGAKVKINFDQKTVTFSEKWFA